MREVTMRRTVNAYTTTILTIPEQYCRIIIALSILHEVRLARGILSVTFPIEIADYQH